MRERGGETCQVPLRSPFMQLKRPVMYAVTAILGTAVAIVAAVTLSGGGPAKPTTFTVSGDLTVLSTNSCEPIRFQQIVITDQAGVTLGYGTTEQPRREGADCRYSFTVFEVPAGLKVYGIEALGHPRRLYQESLLRQDIQLVNQTLASVSQQGFGDRPTRG